MKNKSQFVIGIPTLNRIDLLLPTLLMYCNDFPNTQIIIYDNGAQYIKNTLRGLRHLRTVSINFPSLAKITVLGGSGNNIGVAGAWNEICENAYEICDHVLMLNDDIYLGLNELEINALLEPKSAISGFDFISCEPHHDWSVFLLPAKTFRKVNFDSNFFPAYYEDADAMYRMKLLKLKTFEIPLLNPKIFRRSMTMLKDPNLLGRKSELNRQYYISKWGGDVGDEKFKTPFGVK